MEEAQKKASLKVREIIAGLQSENEVAVLKAVAEIRKYGNPEVMGHLLNAYAKSKNTKIDDAIIAILNDLKDEDALPVLISQLKEKDFGDKKAALLASIWNSGQDASNYVADLVELAVGGNYMECLECLTILGEQEGPFKEENLLEAQITIQSFLTDNKDDEKEPLLHEMVRMIRDIENQM